MGHCHYPSIDESDIKAVLGAASKGWFTHGRLCDDFERRMAQWIGTKYGYFVSSGSAASLLAIASLTSWSLGPRQLKRGDEVITTALAFPTTVAPIVQNGLLPVFVDVEPQTCNASVRLIEKAVTERTKAVVIANTLGNPIDPNIKDFCEEKGLWLVEDNCDGLGGIIAGRKTGTIGHISTCSFYPAHHITTGEGGMVFTDNQILSKAIHSLRNWGRDCLCRGGEDGICGKRFKGQHGSLPEGYDHKYVFSHLGYNLKNTEMAAALGLSQMDKLEVFVTRRAMNWWEYHERLSDYSDYFGSQKATSGSLPSWFGYLVVCRGMAQRKTIVSHLEKNGIQTRMLFAGNILRQPCFTHGDHCFRVEGTLKVTNDLTENAFWLGVAPSVTKDQIEKTCDLMIDVVMQ